MSLSFPWTSLSIIKTLNIFSFIKKDLFWAISINDEMRNKSYEWKTNVVLKSSPNWLFEVIFFVKHFKFLRIAQIIIYTTGKSFLLIAKFHKILKRDYIVDTQWRFSVLIIFARHTLNAFANGYYSDHFMNAWDTLKIILSL